MRTSLGLSLLLMFGFGWSKTFGEEGMFMFCAGSFYHSKSQFFAIIRAFWVLYLDFDVLWTLEYTGISKHFRLTSRSHLTIIFI